MPLSDTRHLPDSTAGLEAVRAAIRAACGRANRDPAFVTLVAASKTVPPEALENVLTAGHRVFGENRVQEAKAKWPGLRDRFPDMELHLIGPLQTNKAREAVSLFDVIHSVDRPSLCEVLARQCAKQDRWPRFFIQVNTGAEPQKAGVLPGEVDGLLARCREYHLDVAGVTCIPPADEPADAHFSSLAKVAARNEVECISMGMSADYEKAIEMGSTHVRVGSAIFGARA